MDRAANVNDGLGLQICRMEYTTAEKAVLSPNEDASNFKQT